MCTLTQDLRWTLRAFAKNPGYAAVAILTLALGIGATTAMWSVVQAVLLEPLPYADPSRLVRIWETTEEAENGNVNPLNFRDWQAQSDVFASLAAFTSTDRTVTLDGASERIRAARVTADYFQVLGAGAALGRTFAPADEDPGSEPVVVVSHGFWQRRLAASPDALDASLSVEGTLTRVIGVLPPGFHHPTAGRSDAPEIYVPLRIVPTWGRGGHWLQGLARLAPGVTLDAAQAQMSTIARRLAEEYPQSNAKRGVLLEPLHDSLVGGVEKALVLLFGAVVLVLLVAAANVANLLLSRAVTRRRELAIRRALGASRGRLFATLLSESLALALAGGGLGLLLTAWARDLVVALAGDSLPRGQEIGIDARVLLFALAVSLATGTVFALAPMGLASRMRVGESLRDNRQEVARGGSGSAVRGGLVIAQMALAVMLVTVASLFLRSFAAVLGIGSGVAADRVTAIEVALPSWRYDEGPRIGSFYRELLERLRVRPEIAAVGAVNNLPFKWHSLDGFRLEDRPEPPPGEGPSAYNQLVTPGYFEAMGMPLIEGRTFTDHDDAEAPQVIIINEAFAREFWPGESALGRRVTYNRVAREIVGVVGDVRRRGLAEGTPPDMFIPHLQEAWDGQMFLTVRSAGERTDPAIAAVRGTVREMDAEVPVGMVLDMEELVAESVAGARFRTWLLGLFAMVGLGLAAVGTYAVMAYTVSRRTREIGVRMALGARTGNVLELVLGRGLRLTVAGIVLGMGGAWMASRWLESLLFAISARDVWSFSGAVIVLAAVALLASLVPARRAARVDPTVALRCE